MIPDRLPSLIVLVGAWIPPAVAGWVAAGYLRRTAEHARKNLIYVVLVVLLLVYAAGWFFFNLGRMPPYIPGATRDPTFAPPRAVWGLAVVASALVLPVSALACILAFRIRRRALRNTSGAVSSDPASQSMKTS